MKIRPSFFQNVLSHPCAYSFVSFVIEIGASNILGLNKFQCLLTQRERESEKGAGVGRWRKKLRRGINDLKERSRDFIQ